MEVQDIIKTDTQIKQIEECLSNHKMDSRFLTEPQHQKQ